MKPFYWLLNQISAFFANIFGNMQRFSFQKLYYANFNPRKDDIYIVTYPKSGTTWMQMILYQLTTNGEMDFQHVYNVSPYFDLGIEDDEHYDQLKSPRIFKTHFSYDEFNDKCKGKIIYIARSGIDVAISQFYHFQSLDFSMTFEKAMSDFFFNRSRNWFKHVSEWQQNRKNRDVLFLRYEDMIDDLEGCVRKVADFCNITIDESEMPRIMERSNFKFMKQHQVKFAPYPIEKAHDFIRKGKKGEGHIYFTKKDREAYQQQFDNYFGNRPEMNNYRFTEKMEKEAEEAERSGVLEEEKASNA